MRLCCFPNCKTGVEAGQWMCGVHWPLVPSPEKRALFKEVKRVQALGQLKPNAALIELVGLCRRAAQMTLSKSEIAAKVSDALDRPLRDQESIDNLFRVVEQDPEPAAPSRGRFAVHKKPDTFDDCAYLAEDACNKCGWVRG